jgi:hypothetical protein
LNDPERAIIPDQNRKFHQKSELSKGTIQSILKSEEFEKFEIYVKQELLHSGITTIQLETNNFERSCRKDQSKSKKRHYSINSTFFQHFKYY